MAPHLDLHGRHVLVLNWRDTWHPEGGGSETYVEQMARGLVERGAVVTMLCPRYPGSRRREVRDGVRYLRTGNRITVYLLVPLLALLGRLPRHDVVVEVQNGVPFLAAAYLRSPVLVLVHHVHREQWPMLFPRPVAAFGWWLEGTVAPRVARRAPYVTVSGSTRDELVGLGVDTGRITVVHNGSPGIDDMVVPRRSVHPSLVVLGRLVPHKRVEIAIDALANLRPQRPDLTLTVVGDGWWHDELVAHADMRGVRDAITFTGHVDEAEKHRHLASAWLNLMPSLKEGWGLVVVEAGMHHTPSVAFRSAGGVTESIVDGETGVLVDDDPEHFATEVGRLLDEIEQREHMGTMAEKHARNYSWVDSKASFASLVDATDRSRVRGGRVPRRRDDG